MKPPYCDTCNKPMEFVGDYFVRCKNHKCSEYAIEYDVEAQYDYIDNSPEDLSDGHMNDVKFGCYEDIGE